MEKNIPIINKHRIVLLLSGFFQVFLISANSYFVFKVWYLGVFLVSFAISLNWTFNVRKINASNTLDRLSYSVGAAIGAAVGLWASVSIYKFFF